MMTSEDVIRMAREAGMERVVNVHADGTRTVELPHPDLLERFAALVYAEGHKDGLDDFEAGVLPAAIAAERDRLLSASELCRVCEQRRIRHETTTQNEANS